MYYVYHVDSLIYYINTKLCDKDLTNFLNVVDIVHNNNLHLEIVNYCYAHYQTTLNTHHYKIDDDESVKEFIVKKMCSKI